MDLLDELSRARREKGLAQDVLGERVGVDRQAIYRFETGVGSFALMLRIMGALDFHLVGLGRGMTLADQFGNRRRAMKLSKAEVARRADITVNTLSRLEQGEGSVSSALKVLAVVGTKKMAPRQPSQVILSPLRVGERDKRFTPIELLTALERVWGPIAIDPCGHIESPVRAQRRILLSEGGCGLRDCWGNGGFAFVNPPFSAATQWLMRATEMHAAGKVDVVVGLVPAKTDTVYFHDHVVHHCDVGFLRGRLQFSREAGAEANKTGRAPFSTMLIAWGASRAEIEHFRSIYASAWLMHEREREREVVEGRVRISEFG